MDKKQLNISELLHPAIEAIPYPTIILSFDLRIILSNQLFIQLVHNKKIIEAQKIFNTDILEELKKKFLLLRETNIAQKISTVSILFEELEIQTDLTINRLQFEEEEYFMVIFSAEEYPVKEFNEIKLKVTDDVKNYIDEELLDFFSEISSLLPFTLLIKNRIKKILNERSEIIWIKDESGKLFLFNKNYEDAVGINIEVLKNRDTDLLIFPYQANIINSSIDYLRLTKKAIVIDGLKFTSEKATGKPLILLPLNDKQGKFFYSAAIISQQKVLAKENHHIFGKIFSEVPLPILIISKDGLIQHSNGEFIKLVSEKSEDLLNKHIQQIFPYLLTENLSSFLESELKEEQIQIDETFNPVDTDFAKYFLKVKKHFDSQGKTQNLILLFYPVEKVDNLEHLIKHRGRMFDILIQKNPEPIFIYDKENLKFLEVNEAALQLYGYSRDEFLQLDLTDLYSPEDIQTLLDSFNESDLDKKFSRPFRHKRKNGSTVFVEISRSEFKFNDKDAHFTIVRDVTDKIEKEKQYKIFQTIFDSTSDPVIVTDAMGFIKFINKSVTERLGYEEKELLDSSFITLAKDEERGLVNSTIFQSSLKEPITIRLSVKKADNQIVESEVVANPLLDVNNEIESFTIVLRMPEIKEAKSETKEIVKEVIKEVIVEKPVKARVNKEIPESSFLSGVFHELLTPLNVIFGFSQEIIDSLSEPTPEQQEAAEIINQNRIKLLDTMNSVIEYTEIIQEKSPIKIQSVSITEIIDKIDRQVKDLVGLSDIEFGYGKISSSLSFETDKDKFERMISGLIKVIARITREKKIYFSAFSLDNESFIISLSDQYGSISSYLSNTLEKLFAEDRDPKDLGAPKLTTHLTKFFVDLLGGKFTKQVNFAGRTECGFIFPIRLSEKQSVEQQEVFHFEQPTETQVESSEIQEQPVFGSQQESEKEVEAPQEILPEEEFEPVTPVSELLTSQLPESEKIEKPIVEQEDELTEISKELDKDLEEVNEGIGTTETTITEKQKEILPPTLDLSKLNCLYIEDQVDSQILFKVQLKGLKDIQFAPSFEDALPLLDKQNFDFIVIDINLQGEYNGLDALKLIHKMPGYENTPIIAVTAYVLPGDKEKFIAAGFDDFIAKPIFREKMIDSLQKIFLSKS
ncbi:PAS/PAC domain protein [Ignavibacterium album JCM 16511]|uniref:histidine kinase n=1 Tax=Ignavibacterium album (strain DSM 19864 / JCM 16511 / NBRC 101810 / Mat9-16) TaxID=945713 RepID=I0AL72_IGNAJ|nr:PAS domain S-box protein [Ignavibacterium album]AFH49729.1 PAS/PAC domain protein [Ignavibacterium album JCM 16511]